MKMTSRRARLGTAVPVAIAGLALIAGCTHRRPGGGGHDHGGGGPRPTITWTMPTTGNPGVTTTRPTPTTRPPVSTTRPPATTATTRAPATTTTMDPGMEHGDHGH